MGLFQTFSPISGCLIIRSLR